MDKINLPLRVLITGGFGYAGGRVAQYLSEKGHQVVLGTRKNKNTPEWLPQSEVIQLFWNDESALTEACKDVNVVIHSAGMNAQDCEADPVAALKFNGVATARLVQASKNAGVTKFIYLSTAHVYRSPLVGEIDENTCPRNLFSYATSHLAGENTVLYGAETQSDFTGIVLRLSNVIGAPVHKDVNCWMLLVNDLCRQVVTSKQMVLRTSGQQKRDFITLTDACRAIGHLMELPVEKLGNGLFNVGGGWSTSIIELTQLLGQRVCLETGNAPEIFKKDEHVIKDVVLLDYQINKLLDTGFELVSDINKEIDGLVQFCLKHLMR